MKIRSAAILFLVFFLGIPPLSVAGSEINQQITPSAVVRTIMLPVSNNPVVPLETASVTQLPENSCPVFNIHSLDPVNSAASINLHDGGNCYGSLRVASGLLSEQSLVVAPAPVLDTHIVVMVLPTWQKQAQVNQGNASGSVASAVVLVAGFTPPTEQRPITTATRFSFQYNLTASHNRAEQILSVMRC